MDVSDRAPVLMYHRIGPEDVVEPSLYSVTPGRFALQMQRLADAGHRAVGIDRLVHWLEGGAPLRPGDFVLTFDDGYRGVLEHADPVLRELCWPYTVFLVTDRLGGTDTWNGGRYPLLDTSQVRQMQERGCDFQSHTRSHARLPLLDDVALEAELAGSREALTALLGRAPDCLAYPFGDADERVVAAARGAGYRAAFSVQSGFNSRAVDRWRLRRLDVWSTDTPTMLLRKVRMGTNDGSLGNMLRYRGRRVVARASRLLD